jgi:tetratricopeptide (TPR) repeat protein
MVFRWAAAGIALLLLGVSVPAEPYQPAAEDEVIERLPLATDPALREVGMMARELAERPDDLGLALAIAQRYVAIGRSEGDPRYFGLAEGVLGPWWSLPEPSPAVRRARAAVVLGRHDFAAARADLDLVLAADPGNVQALLDRAAVLEAIGDPAAAERDCAKVARLRPGLAAVACLASAASLSGAAHVGEVELSAALLSADQDNSRAWAATIFGEIAARRGDHAAAEARFRDALAAGGYDIYVLTALADLYLDADRPDEVLRLTEGAERQDALLLRRALAMREVSPAEAPPLIDELAARFAALRLRGDDSHLRDEARFMLALAGRPEDALALASRNWTRQRAPADARILLEAALAAGRPDAAMPVRDWMAATGIEDLALRNLARRLDAAS